MKNENCPALRYDVRLLKFSETERFGEFCESNAAGRVRLEEFRHERIPAHEDRILPAPVPMRLARCGGEEEQPVAITVNGHADLVRAHPRCEFRPQLVVGQFVALESTR